MRRLNVLGRRSIDDEQALVTRANAGDRAALEQLYRDHRDWATGLAYQFTGSHDDALDVLQETYIYFYSKFPGFHLTSTIRSFLYPVVKHRCISILRRRRKLVDLESYRGGEEELRWVHAETGDDYLRRQVATLPEGQREVIRLRFGFEFRLEEIADALGIPVGTVKSRLHNALKTLRNAVSRDEPQTNRGQS